MEASEVLTPPKHKVEEGPVLGPVDAFQTANQFMGLKTAGFSKCFGDISLPRVGTSIGRMPS